MRAFSHHFAALLGLALLLSAIGAITSKVTGAQSENPLVIVATIDGEIDNVAADYLHRALERAHDENATALIIELNTRGGLSTAMDDIVDDIVRSAVPVVVYVSPPNARAASAGVFITYASHIAAMAPTTNIGSASPILIGSTGSDESDETLTRKVRNDAIARITNLAELRGRNVNWAVSAVENAENITADQALELHVVDLISPDLPTLLASINGQTVQTEAGPVTIDTTSVTIEHMQMTAFEQVRSFLANPTLAYLLVTFGLIALFIELANPGIGIPAVAGSLSLILGLIGLGSLPVEWIGLGLMALAFVLFIVDLFVPSLGLLTIGGIVCFLVGSNILIDDGTPSNYQVSRAVIWTMTACFGATAILLGFVVVRSQLKPPKTGMPGMVGQVGVVRTALDPEGQIMVFGEIWSAQSSAGPIQQGEHVTVERSRKLKLTVRRATSEEIEGARVVGDRRVVIAVQ